MEKYKVKVDLMTDAKGKPGAKNYQEMKTYPIGSIVTDDDFPRDVIRNWVKRGILKKIKSKGGIIKPTPIMHEAGEGE